MNNEETWQAVLAELELGISKANFNTWFKDTGISLIENGDVIICVPNMFTKAWIEKKYHSFIIKSLERITSKPIKKLEYKIENIKKVKKANEIKELAKTENLTEVGNEPSPFSGVDAQAGLQPTSGGFTLNQKYTFSSFVVGSETELAYAAAQAVVNKPGESYNPLFIYGGVGLGKTHLLQAIGNPNFNIVYVSAEKFSNDFIDSVRSGKAKEFQNRYRHTDLLLIDDIQFIAGKEKTQESFFHTFNELHQQNKQVVLTSDRPPKAIPALEDRLKSRFEWGMIADVAVPNFETRVAILSKKCTERNFKLDDEILRTIAVSIQRNIRELEGALNKIIAYHDLKNVAPTTESVKSLLSSIEASGLTRSVTPTQLLETVTEFYNLVPEDVIGKSREKRLSSPRQVIMYLMRKELNMSYPAIGDELGGRDHTTAMHAHTKIQNLVEVDAKLKQEIELIKQRLYINNI